MTDATDHARNVSTVQRFLDAFNAGWPTDDDLDELLTPDVRMLERPNLVNPSGSDRDAATMRAGLQAGRALLAWQRYDVRDHLASGDTVVTRMRWSGELAIDAGPWTKGTKLSASCVAHYRLRDGRITEIEQHDCYGPPEPPA